MILKLLQKFLFTALIGLSWSGCVCNSPAKKSSTAGIGAVTQEQRFALLDRAVGETNIAELKRLVRDSSLRTEVKTSGYDLLITAINNRSYEMVKILLNAGADANFGVPSFNTPLMEASVLGQLKIVDILLKRGAKVNARSNQGFTALHLVAIGPPSYQWRRDQILEALQKEPSIENSKKLQELKKEEKAYVATAELLLKWGARANLRVDTGETAVDVARESGQVALERLLRKYSGNRYPRRKSGVP